MSRSPPDLNLPLGDRLVKMAIEAREKARQLAPGAERDALLTEARRAEDAASWLQPVRTLGPQPR